MTAAPGVDEESGVELDPRVLRLRSGVWELDVLPDTGAALAAGRIRTREGWRDLLRPTPAGGRGVPERCASFVMVPWSNRVRGGVLRYRGQTWRLQHDGADGTAIHGATRYASWGIEARSPGSVTLSLDTSDLIGINFPWRFVARVTYALDGGRLTVSTSVQNVDVEPFPAGFGHHPYLRRSLVAPGATPSSSAQPVLHVPAERGYPLEAGMAVGPAGPVPPRADFRRPRRLGAGFVDDVLTGWDGTVGIQYDEGVRVDLTADPTYSHVVLYAPQRRAYFAVEPVTNVNDAFTLHAAGVPGTGVLELQPEEVRTARFTLDVTPSEA
ncbi:aldose epimerase [Cellulomonas sp. DKR-3]|uniref:Aldose epimerase n=1 Tax=Cellulomonas fulva TaxID=2835530 RepID=A0ABS5TX38_9CELL|nr:aldose epimerase [Cellulomonas fulva]MBT0993657.1 aldose epimerase [Cellulomonas fulva]